MRDSSEKRKTTVRTKIHIVEAKLKDRTRYYVYAWRNGPCIHRQDNSYPVINASLLARQQAAMMETRSLSRGVKVSSLVRKYKDSALFQKKADNTKRNYLRSLNEIEDEFGNWELVVFDDRRTQGAVLDWRDRWADRPRTADQHMSMFSRLMKFAVKRGLLEENRYVEIEQLHKVSKADQIWEPRHWTMIEEAELPEHLMDAIHLGALTGARVSDLVNIHWSNVFENRLAIPDVIKSKTRAVIPLIKELREWLDGRPRDGIILRNSRGQPWTESGMESVWQKNKPKGFDRTLHDLRGTYATKMIIMGIADEHVALFLGWKTKRIADLRRRYVDESIVMDAVSEKVGSMNFLQETVK